MQKAPDQPWPPAARGLEIILEPGVHGPGELDGCPDMLIQGGEGVVIHGSLVPRGNEPECGLRVHNGAHRLRIIGPLEVRYSEGRGVRVTEAESIALSDIWAHHCGIEGIITGNCPRGTYEAIRVEHSRSLRNGYSDDKRHGIYIAGDGSGSRVSGLKSAHVTGSGGQFSGAGMGAIIRDLLAEELEFIQCGSGGTPPLSMMGVQNSEIRKFCCDWVPDNHRWGVMFADGKGAKYACYDNRLYDYTVPRGSYCAELEGSTRNEFVPGAGWSPEGPPEPPEPEPPTDLEQILKLLTDAQNALNQSRTERRIAQTHLFTSGKYERLAQFAIEHAEQLVSGS